MRWLRMLIYSMAKKEKKQMAETPTTVRPGDRVKDRISGTQGIVTARTEWLYGCVRITAQPEESKDGKPVDPFVIDEAQCIVVEAQAVRDTRPAAKPDPPHGDRESTGSRPQEPRR